ncbi:MAG: zinc ribbon domain-containing protein [Myxococcales bacterium]|nr:zinc ribbon domain-containing protein [Myxococcales bacterium]
MKCSECSNELQPGWKLCPLCGTRQQEICIACGAELRPDWKLCPHCGVSAARGSAAELPPPAAPTVAAPTAKALEFPWNEALPRSLALKSSIDRVVTARLDPVFAHIRSAASVADGLAARDPEVLWNAAASAIESMAQLGDDPELPGALREPLQRLRERQAELLASLVHPGRLLGQAIAAARQNNVGAGRMSRFVAAFERNVAKGEGPGLADGLLELGSAMDSAVQVWGQGQRDQSLLDAVSDAASLMDDAVSRLLDASWDHVVVFARERGIELKAAEFFRSALAEWERISRTVLCDVSAASAAHAEHTVRGFVQSFGPHAMALTALVRLKLPPHGTPDEQSIHDVELLLGLYPKEPSSYEAAADLALECNDPSHAVELASFGQKLAPDHAGLALTRVEALAAAGAVADARASAAQAIRMGGSNEAFFYLARGLTRADRHEEAVDVVNAWMNTSQQPARIRIRLSSDPITTRLFEAGALGAVTHTEHPRAVVESFLVAAPPKTYLGAPAEPQASNAQAAFLMLGAGEKILFFHDLSLLTNGKSGFAITTRRVCWKGIWAAPVALDLSRIDFGAISAEGTQVRLAGHAIDVGDSALADAIASAIAQMRAALPVDGLGSA